MTTGASTGKSESEKIWAALDAEDAGTAVAPVVLESPEPAAAVAAVVEAPAVTADAPVDTPPAAGQELLDKVAGLESMLTQATSRLRTAEGHIGNLNGQLKQFTTAAAAATARGADAPSKEQIQAASTSTKAMAALKESYPEFAGHMEAVLEEQRAETQRLLAAATAAAPQTPGLTSADLNGLRGELQVEFQHPGWQARVKTPEFGGWLQRQPREVQLLAASEVTGDAIRLLDLHKKDTAAAPDTTAQRRLDAAAAIPSGRAGATTRVKPIEEMTKAEFWAYQDQLDKQNQPNTRR